jgi:FkbM family methyltransferase
VLTILKSAIKRMPLLDSLFRAAYGAVFLRFTERRVYIRYRLVGVLRNLSALITREGLAGGLMTEAGDYYLRMPDGVFVFYNHSNAQHSLGDGQSLEFKDAQALPELERFIESNLGNEAVYFDVGANNGYFYCLKVARKYPGCRIHAFEPDSRALFLLRKNIEFNGARNITVVPVALADYAGIGKMPAFLGASGFLIRNGGSAPSPVAVQVNTLDNYVEEQGIDRLDLMKVDIEGGEFDFLKGSKSVLARFRPPLIVELKEELLRRSHASADDIRAFFQTLDYRGYQIVGSNDALFIPREKTAGLPGSDSKWLDPLH